MIHQLAYTQAVAQRRDAPAVADRARIVRTESPSNHNATDRADLGSAEPGVVGGFGLDLAYSRQSLLTASGRPEVGVAKETAASVKFRFALNALPRDEAGKVDLAGVVNEEELHQLEAAVVDLAEMGLKDPGALASFVNAVDVVFDEYESDLSLSEGELDQARQMFVDEVKGFFAAAEGEGPSSFPVPFDVAVQSLRDRIRGRRDDVLVAAGDLSKVLAEHSHEAVEAPTDEAKQEQLGRLLGQLEEAHGRRSTRELRSQARQRLLQHDGEIAERAQKQPKNAEAVAAGQQFAAHLISQRA